MPRVTVGSVLLLAACVHAVHYDCSDGTSSTAPYLLHITVDAARLEIITVGRNSSGPESSIDPFAATRVSLQFADCVPKDMRVEWHCPGVDVASLRFQDPHCPHQVPKPCDSWFVWRRHVETALGKHREQKWTCANTSATSESSTSVAAVESLSLAYNVLQSFDDVDVGRDHDTHADTEAVLYVKGLHLLPEANPVATRSKAVSVGPHGAQQSRKETVPLQARRPADHETIPCELVLMFNASMSKQHNRSQTSASEVRHHNDDLAVGHHVRVSSRNAVTNRAIPQQPREIVSVFLDDSLQDVNITPYVDGDVHPAPSVDLPHGACIFLEEGDVSSQDMGSFSAAGTTAAQTEAIMKRVDAKRDEAMQQLLDRVAKQRKEGKPSAAGSHLSEEVARDASVKLPKIVQVSLIVCVRVVPWLTKHARMSLCDLSCACLCVQNAFAQDLSHMVNAPLGEAHTSLLAVDSFASSAGAARATSAVRSRIATSVASSLSAEDLAQAGASGRGVVTDTGQYLSAVELEDLISTQLPCIMLVIAPIMILLTAAMGFVVILLIACWCTTLQRGAHLLVDICLCMQYADVCVQTHDGRNYRRHFRASVAERQKFRWRIRKFEVRCGPGARVLKFPSLTSILCVSGAYRHGQNSFSCNDIPVVWDLAGHGYCSSHELDVEATDKRTRTVRFVVCCRLSTFTVKCCGAAHDPSAHATSSPIIATQVLARDAERRLVQAPPYIATCWCGELLGTSVAQTSTTVAGVFSEHFVAANADARNHARVGPYCCKSDFL